VVPDPQRGVNAPQTRHTIFLVLSVKPDATDAARTRLVCGGLDALQRAVAARATEDDRLDCVVAFGADAWDRLFGDPKPRELHPFRELRSGPRYAPSTPGDILFHISAERMDLCFELAAQIMVRLTDSVTPQDEVHGFRYFDNRDLTGFVDGTENPQGNDSLLATLVGDEDPTFAGGSYVMVQKYIHDHARWIALPTETQERIIGRTKLDDIELDDSVKPTYAHNALTSLVEDGEELEVRRHNMPFGKISDGEAGTYFIAYGRTLQRIETMLEHMVLGDPPGNYDRLLDFTHAVTGTNFFAPSVQFLAALANAAPAATNRAGALDIGSLKGVPQHE
jgi:putative iron-dependent peroxidase